MADYKLLKNDIVIEADAAGNLKDPTKQYFIANMGVNKDKTKYKFQHNPVISIHKSKSFITISTTFGRNDNSVSNPLLITVLENTTSSERLDTIYLLNSDSVQSECNLIIKLDAGISYGDVTVSLLYPNNLLSWDDISQYTPTLTCTQSITENGVTEERSLSSTDLKNITYTVNDTTIATIDANTGKINFKSNNTGTTEKSILVTVNVTSKYGDKIGSATYTIKQNYPGVSNTTYNLTGTLSYVEASSAGGTVFPTITKTVTQTLTYADGHEETEDIDIDDTTKYEVTYTYVNWEGQSYATLVVTTGKLTWEEMPVSLTTPREFEVSCSIRVTLKSNNSVIITTALTTTAYQLIKEIEGYTFGALLATLSYNNRIPAIGGLSDPTVSLTLTYSIRYTDGTNSSDITETLPDDLVKSIKYTYSCDDIALPDKINQTNGSIKITVENTNTAEKQHFVLLIIIVTYIDNTELTTGANAYCILNGAQVREEIPKNLQITLSYNHGSESSPVSCEGETIYPTVTASYEEDVYLDGVYSHTQTGTLTILITYEYDRSAIGPDITINYYNGLLVVPDVGNNFSNIMIGSVTATASVATLSTFTLYDIWLSGHQKDIEYIGPTISLSYNNGNPIDAVLSSELTLSPTITYSYLKKTYKVCNSSRVLLSTESFNNTNNSNKFTVEYTRSGTKGSINSATGVYKITNTNTTENEITITTISAKVTIKENGLNDTSTYIIKLKGDTYTIVNEYNSPRITTFTYSDAEYTAGSTSVPTLVWTQTYNVVKKWNSGNKETIESGKTITDEEKSAATIKYSDTNLNGYSLNTTTGVVTWEANTSTTTDRSTNNIKVSITLYSLGVDKTAKATLKKSPAPTYRPVFMILTSS